MDKNPKTKWRGLETKIQLIPLMIHKHKNCEPCEPHIRAQLSFGLYLGGSEPLLDIPLEMFNELKPI